MLSNNYETNGVLKKVSNVSVNAAAAHLDLGQIVAAASSLSEWTNSFAKSSHTDDRSDQENDDYSKGTKYLITKIVNN
jgi:hypothetical protein